MVGSLASVCGERFRSVRVLEVMGPIEMRGMPNGRLRLDTSSKARRFFTVELLVKVMASG